MIKENVPLGLDNRAQTTEYVGYLKNILNSENLSDDTRKKLESISEGLQDGTLPLGNARMLVPVILFREDEAKMKIDKELAQNNAGKHTKKK